MAQARDGGIRARWALVATLLALAAVGIGTPGARAGDGFVAVGDPEWRSYTKGLEVRGLSSLQIHAKTPDVLYAFVHGLGIAKSTNQGQAWTPMVEGIDKRDLPTPRDAVTLTLDPRDARVLYATIRGKIYKSENEGRLWAPIQSQTLASWSFDRRQSAMRIAGVAVDPGKSVHLLAGTRAGEGFHGGLFESLDGGKRWVQLAGSNMPESGLGRDAWPIALDAKTDKMVILGGEDGIYVSEDRGNHFKLAELGESAGPHDVRDLTEVVQKDVYACDARGVWYSRDGGKKWGKAPVLPGDAVTVEVDPAMRKRVFAVLRDRGLFLSEDPRREKWGKKVTYADLELRDLVFHPRDREVVFATSPVTGLSMSKDRGETFEEVAATLPAVVPAVAAVAGHPAEEGRFLAATTEGLVFSSADRGVTWERVGRLGVVPGMVVPDPSGVGAWWAVGQRVLHSPDGGKAWDQVFAPEAREDRIVGFVRSEDGTLRVLLERGRAVATSKDGGKSWETGTAVGASERMAWATSLAVDPKNPEHLLVATRTRTAPWNPKDEEGGPYESWDGGKTWRHLPEGLFAKNEPRRQWNAGSLAGIDPVTGNLYYGADGAGFFVRQATPPSAPDEEKDEEKKGAEAEPAAAWVHVPDGGVPTPSFHAFLLRGTADGSDSEVVVQVEGENEARAVLVSSGTKLAAMLVPPADGAERPKPWDAGKIKDPASRLDALAVDPFSPGRLIAGDRFGERGVLVYEPEGEAPAAPSQPEKPVEPGPAAPPSAAPKEPAKAPAGLAILSGGMDKTVRVLDVAGGQPKGIPDHGGEILSLAVSPDGQTFASASADRTIRLWKTADATAVATLGPAENGAAVESLAFAPGGATLFAGCRENWAVVRWDLAAKKAKRLGDHAGAVLALAVAPDGSRLFSGGEDARILTWDLATDAKIPLDFAFPGEVHALALSPDGTRLYVAGSSSSVYAFSTADGKQIASRDLAPATWFHALALSPDGATLYVGGMGGVRALKADDLTTVVDFTGPEKDVHALGLATDGAWLAAGDASGQVWLWDVTAPAPTWTSGAAVHDGGAKAVRVLLAAAAATPPGPPAPAPVPPGPAPAPAPGTSPGRPAPPDKPPSPPSPPDAPR